MEGTSVKSANTEPMLLKINDVMARLQIGRNQAYQLVNSGQLPVIRIGKSIRIPVDGLRRWIESQQAS